MPNLISNAGIIAFACEAKSFHLHFSFHFSLFLFCRCFLTDRERLFGYISSFVTQDGEKRIGLLYWDTLATFFVKVIFIKKFRKCEHDIPYGLEKKNSNGFN